jgi:Rrf2 family protein
MEPQSNRPAGGSLITQTSEYALRAVVHLAQRPDGPSAAQEIAEATRVPVGYLQKILRMLSRAGILNAQRGAGGGFSLAKVPSAIAVLDVLSATDTDISRIERCPLGIKGHTSLCPLHSLLDEQIAGVRNTFASTSIADLLAQDPGARALCSGQGIQSLTTERSAPARKPRTPKPPSA